jgi:hypothetical protein
MKTHPDAVGSDRLLGKYLEFNVHYEDAKRYLSGVSDSPSQIENSVTSNCRLEYFKQLHIVESLEMPYAYHPEENLQKIRAAKVQAIQSLSTWKPALVDLYRQADEEYVTMKHEKPRGPYLKYALALNVRPILHNVIAFHLTGRNLYLKQARQNLSAILHIVKERGYPSLHDFILELLEDTKTGAAVLE